jgi:hypothetical protein
LRKTISTFARMQKHAKMFSLLLFMFLMSVKSFSQDPDPGDPDPGGPPDGPPPAIPLNDYLLPILLIAGILLVFFVMKRMDKKKLSH